MKVGRLRLPGEPQWTLLRAWGRGQQARVLDVALYL